MRLILICQPYVSILQPYLGAKMNKKTFTHIRVHPSKHIHSDHLSTPFIKQRILNLA